MLSLVRKSLDVMTACVLALVFSIPSDLVAQAHVVKPAELQNAMLAVTETRQHDVETIRQFLSTPAAEKALKAAHVDPAQVKQAAASLSDQELAQLAARAQKAQADLAAGSLSERDLLIILIGIAVVILIIVAVR